MSPARKKASGETAPCPWCSSVVPVEAATCPSCGASLREAAEGEILGVTQVDPKATSKLGRMQPSRLASWLGAERTSDSPALDGRVEPPSEEVRREMLRLELAALDAEIAARANQAAAERDLPLDDGAEPQAG